MTVFYNTATDSETTVTPGDNLVSSEERSITIRQGGTVTRHGDEASTVDTYQSFNMASVDPSGGLQARTKTGSPRYGDLQMTDIVKVPGGETTLQNAVSLGMVERDQNGRWVLVPDGGSRALANEQPQEAYQDDGEALPDASIEQDLGDLCSSVSPSVQVAIAQQMITDGAINPNTIARAAGEANQEPGVISERINTVVQGFQAQTDSVLRGLGAEDTSLFYQWAQEHHPEALRKAMTDQVMERTTKNYEPLFRQYVETLAVHSPEDILSAEFGSGITARMVDKQVVLNIPGYGSMPYRSAVNAGLINVKGV